MTGPPPLAGPDVQQMYDQQYMPQDPQQQLQYMQQQQQQMQQGMAPAYLPSQQPNVPAFFTVDQLPPDQRFVKLLPHQANDVMEQLEMQVSSDRGGGE